MFDRIRSIAGALASVALVLTVGACSDAPLPTAQDTPDLAQARGGAQKFTFQGVTLADGDLVVENAVIEAGVKDQKKDRNDWTNCSYFTEAWGEHLGQFGEGEVPGDGGADAVRTFCIENFENR
jgi:hypothetical protein